MLDQFISSRDRLNFSTLFCSDSVLRSESYFYLESSVQKFCLVLGLSSDLFKISLQPYEKIFIFHDELSSFKSLKIQIDDELFKKLEIIFSLDDFISLSQKISFQDLDIFYLNRFSKMVPSLELLFANQQLINDLIIHSSEKVLDNTIHNLRLDITCVNNLQYQDKTVLIIGAGPSLKGKIEEIKIIRSEVLIFSCLRSCNYLIKEGIFPDYVGILDSREMIDQLDQAVYKISCLCSLQANYQQVKLFDRRIIIPHQTIFPISEFLQDQVELGHKVDPGHTVVSFLTSAAIMMKFKQIILYGVDLCYEDECKYFFSSSINKTSLVITQKKDGTEVFSQKDFLVTKAWLENKASVNKSLVFVNRSDGLDLTGFSPNFDCYLFNKTQKASGQESVNNYSKHLEKIYDALDRIVSLDQSHPLFDILLNSDLHDLGLLNALENLFSLLSNLGIVSKPQKKGFFLEVIKDLKEKLEIQ